MPEPMRSFVVRPGEGDQIAGPVGGPTTIKARTRDTGGSFALLENVIPPFQGPPLHVHAREDEMWYVTEGNLRFRAEDEILEAPQGSFVFVPRGTRHCFQNIGDTAATVLVMFAPGGMERFFDELAELLPGTVHPEAYRAVAERNWMEVAGPPLAESHPL
ncbi:MAG: cupin domain-containing protein [Chloroflexi bacterium]|nr:cupin domain-containing protein [Chloroflexota bacterium]MDA1145381.1 cupin domain-containing protein [Chloroflexota bacterium]